MKQVGVRELKAKLSQYLREVTAGEFIEVTDRGKVVAELKPPGAAAGVSIYEARFHQWVREGRIKPASKPPKAGLFRAVITPLPPGSAQELLDEIREERDLL